MQQEEAAAATGRQAEAAGWLAGCVMVRVGGCCGGDAGGADRCQAPTSQQTEEGKREEDLSAICCLVGWLPGRMPLPVTAMDYHLSCSLD